MRTAQPSSAHVDSKGRPLRPLVAAGHELATVLLQHCDWFSGVPDSLFRAVLPYLSPYLPAPRENHALAMAFGARLGGRRPCLLLQNSGLGLLADTLYGLQHLYGLGTLLLVSWRGELPWEEPQHRQWGKNTVPFLKALEIPFFDLEELGLQAVARGAECAFRQERTCAVLVHRGNIDEQG